MRASSFCTCCTYGQCGQMNITRNTRFPAKLSRVTVSPETPSFNAKSGAGVPSPSIVDSVAGMLPFYLKEEWMPGERQVRNITSRTLHGQIVEQQRRRG